MELKRFVELLVTVHQERAEALKVRSRIFKSSGILLHVDQFAPCEPVFSMWTSLLHMDQLTPCRPVYFVWTSLLHVDQ